MALSPFVNFSGQRIPFSTQTQNLTPLLSFRHRSQKERQQCLKLSLLHVRCGWRSSKRKEKKRKEESSGSSSSPSRDEYFAQQRTTEVFPSEETSSDASSQSQLQATSSPLPFNPSVKFVGIAIVAAISVGALYSFVLRYLRLKTPVDALATRGFVSADRRVPLKVIKNFQDPTAVRNYRIGNTELVEIEPLSPLSEEKIEFHRQQRLKEYGWLKPALVLVEGEPIPDGVDPKSVRFIPKRHPFALAQNELDDALSEEVVKRRLSQRRGRPEKERERAQRQLERIRKEMEDKENRAMQFQAEQQQAKRDASQGDLS